MFRVFEDYLLESEVSINGEPCGIFVGKFQPIHNGHMEHIRQLSKDLGDTKICLFYTSSDSKRKISRSLVEQMLYDVMNMHDDIISAIYHIDNLFLGNMISLARKDNFQPVGAACSPDKFKEYQRQLSKIKSGMYTKDGITCDPSFKIFKYDNESGIRADRIRKAIMEDDKQFFEDNCPKEIHRFYLELRNELQKTI